MSLPYPPILESQAPSRAAGEVGIEQGNEFRVFFNFPRNQNPEEIGHIGILIRQQLTLTPWSRQSGTGNNTVSPLSPDREVIYLNVGQTIGGDTHVSYEELRRGNFRIPPQALRTLRRNSTTNELVPAFNASNSFEQMDEHDKNNLEVPGQVYTIQIRFGIARMVEDPLHFADWHARQVANRQFGEWSNVQRMFVYALPPHSVWVSGENYETHDFVTRSDRGETIFFQAREDISDSVESPETSPQHWRRIGRSPIFPDPTVDEDSFLGGFSWQYNPISEDALAQVRLTYNYFSPDRQSRAVQSQNLPFQSNIAVTVAGGTRQWGAHGDVELTIARATVVQCIVEMLTVNNTLFVHSFEINRYWDGRLPVPLGTTSILTLRGEEIDDGVIAVSFAPFTIHEFNNQGAFQIYRLNVRTMEGLFLGIIPNGARWPFVARDYCVEMGAEYAYIAISPGRRPLSQVAPLFQANRAGTVLWRPQDYEGIARNMNFNGVSFLTSAFQQLRLTGNVQVRNFNRTVSHQLTQTVGGKYPFIARPSDFNYRVLTISALISIQFDPTHTFLNLVAPPERGAQWWQGDLKERKEAFPWVARDGRIVTSEERRLIVGASGALNLPSRLLLRRFFRAPNILIPEWAEQTRYFAGERVVFGNAVFEATEDVPIINPPNLSRFPATRFGANARWKHIENEALDLDIWQINVRINIGSLVPEHEEMPVPAEENPDFETVIANLTTAARNAGLKDYVQDIVLRNEDVFEGSSSSRSVQREFVNQYLKDGFLVGDEPKLSALEPGTPPVGPQWRDPNRPWVPGDFNGDGVLVSIGRGEPGFVDDPAVNDGVAFARMLVGSAPSLPNYTGHTFDMNGDGFIDSRDATRLARMAAGLNPTPPHLINPPSWFRNSGPVVLGDFNGDGVFDEQDLLDYEKMWPPPGSRGELSPNPNPEMIPPTYNGHPFAIADPAGMSLGGVEDLAALRTFYHNPDQIPAGLLKYVEDPSLTFLDQDDHGTFRPGGALTKFDTHEGQNTSYAWHENPSANIFAERQFRDRVMSWLSDGKPKLFRSETEGNMIVSISGVSFSPLRQDRLVYSVSMTLTEIAEYTLKNLLLYDLIPIDFSGSFKETPEFLANPETVDQRQFKFIPSVEDRNPRVALPPLDETTFELIRVGEEHRSIESGDATTFTVRFLINGRQTSVPPGFFIRWNTGVFSPAALQANGLIATFTAPMSNSGGYEEQTGQIVARLIRARDGAEVKYAEPFGLSVQFLGVNPSPTGITGVEPLDFVHGGIDYRHTFRVNTIPEIADMGNYRVSWNLINSTPRSNLQAGPLAWGIDFIPRVGTKAVAQLTRRSDGEEIGEPVVFTITPHPETPLGINTTLPLKHTIHVGEQLALNVKVYPEDAAFVSVNRANWVVFWRSLNQGVVSVGEQSMDVPVSTMTVTGLNEGLATVSARFLLAMTDVGEEWESGVFEYIGDFVNFNIEVLPAREPEVIDGNNLPENYIPNTGDIINYSFVGSPREITLPKGTYQMECWGASGHDDDWGGTNSGRGGKGAYARGTLNIADNLTLHIYVGEGRPYKIRIFNGGGSPSGAGSTDIRLIGGEWSEINSLRSRIMIAAGGGGGNDHANGGFGGTFTGGMGATTIVNTHTNNNPAIGTGPAAGGSQTGGGAGATTGMRGDFGTGGRHAHNAVADFGGGGAGYFGGAAGDNNRRSGAGGSSFVSGHDGCNALNANGGQFTNQPNHHSGHVFTGTQMLGGNAIIPLPNDPDNDTERGHTGHGFIRITAIEVGGD